VVNDERRNKRLRLLISRLNKERKRQAKKIDILCNDFIAAQKEFINSLKVIGFAADFYECIAGLTDLNELLATAANSIKEQIQDVNVAFFILSNNNFEMHIFESPGAPGIDFLAPSGIEGKDRRIENFFTTELVETIAQSNQICTIDDMLAMGLAVNPRCLEKIAAAGLPLNHRGCSLGFVLLYRASRHPFTCDELKSIDQISTGLSRSIAACRAFANNVQSV
jgi:hypothetical protein